MRKLKLFFACLLMAVLSIGQVWGADVTSKMDLDDQSPAYTANTTSYTGTQSATWTLSKTCASQSVGSETSASSDKYYQIGSGSKNATSMTWSSSSFNGKKIKQVVVKCSSSASATGTNKATVTVTATGGTFSPATSGSNVLSGSTYTTVTFNSSASGGDQISGSLTVDIAFSSQQQKNIRLYQIDVVYVSEETPSCTEPTTALSITNENTVTLGSTLELTTNSGNGGGNGGTITWSVAAGTGTASVEGNVLTPLTKGTVTVTATQEVTDGKCGAAPTQEITISKAAPAAIDGGIVDELIHSALAATGTGYTAFSNKQATNIGHSSAVYAGKTARNGNSTQYNIQMNSVGANTAAGREIATTTSGGYAKRVYVTWATQSTNTDNRKLTVYGQNTAYTGSETATSGTKIGDIVFATGDAFEYLDIAADYKYIQIVANNAIYMDEIDITWLPISSAVTITSPTHGTISVKKKSDDSNVTSGTSINDGTVLKVSIADVAGYSFTNLRAYKTGDQSTTVTITNGELTMPDYPITITADETALLDVNIAVNDNTMGTATLNGGTSTVYVENGGTVNLAVASVADHHEFVNWTATTGITITNTTATSTTATVTAAGTITANFQAQSCIGLAAPTLDDITKDYQSATIAWNTVTNASSYLLNVTKHVGGASAFSGNVGNVLTKAISNLDANTQYDYSIMAVGDGSTYCGENNPLLEGSFTTPDYPTVTVTYSENGNTDNQVSKKIHTPFNLPTSAAACGKTFVGWTTKSDFVDGDESEASYYAKGAEFTITSNANITIYAVYADVVPGAVAYTLTPATSVSAGTYVIAAFDENFKALTGSVTTGSNYDLINEAEGFSIDANNKIVSLPGEAGEFTFTAVTGGFSIQNAEGDYFGYTDANTNRRLAFGEYSSLVWNATELAVTDFPDDGLYIATTAYRVFHNTTTSSTSMVRGYKSTQALGKPIYLFKKSVGAETVSNYSITCVDAPTATPASNPLEVSAAGVNDATLGVTYDNVNLAGVSVDICNDDQGAAFTGDWLTATIAGEDKHIEYTVQANTSYNDARTAYLKLTAPETSGAASPAVVYIEVTQAKKPAVFANIAELVAANVNTGTQVTVTFEEVITNDQTISGPKRAGLFLTTTAGSQSKAIEVFYNQGTTAVPAEWQIGGKLAATSMSFTWTLFGGTQWELIPLGDSWTWDNGDLTYTAPKAVSSIVVSGAPSKDTYVDGEKFNPAGLTVTINYNDATSEVNPTGVTFACTPERVAKSENPVSVSVVATFNEVSSEAFPVNVTVGDIQLKTTQEFIAAGNADMRCYLEGVVSDIETGSKLKYGNFNLTDANGTIYVYGCLNQEGEAEQFGTLGVANGDKIKVIAEDYEYYNSKHEAKNVQFVSKISPVEITIADKTLEEGEEWTIEATTDPAGAVANISYSIKEGSDGCITLDNVNKKITANSVGTATIIASIPDGEGYLANSIEFEVEVVEAGSVANVVILVEYEGAWYAMKHDKSGVLVDYQPAIGKIYGMTDPDKQAEIVWTRSKTGTTYTFTTGNKYIKGANSGTSLSVETGETGKYQWEKGAEETYYHCTTGRTFFYNGTDFKNYAIGNAGTSGYSSLPKVELSDDIFTSNTIYTRTVSGNYGTICMPKAGVLTNGTLFEIAYYGQTSKKIFFDEIPNNEMVAGRPYLFKPNENVTELKVAYTDSEDPVAAGNYKGLHGFYNLEDEDATFNIAQDAGNYIMYSNQYWLVSGRDAYIENYRAYIVLSDITTIEPAKAPGVHRVAMNVNGTQVATGFENLNASEKPVKLMIDGNIYILRGEKLYDATGRLVK